MGLILAFVLAKHILGPVRLLAMEAGRENYSADSENEVKALSRSVRGLIENYDQTHLELERSRETLVQAEKLAMVGKLAAGVAPQYQKSSDVGEDETFFIGEGT